MRFPLKIETLHVDDGISAFAASRDGQLIAIGTSGMLGVYRVSERGYMQHAGTFTLPHDRTRVTHIAFSRNSRTLIVRSEDGQLRELSLEKKSSGLLHVMRASGIGSGAAASAAM